MKLCVPMQVNFKNAAAQHHNAPALGLLCLDTRFPRFAGDGGLAESFPCPVLEIIVPEAEPVRVVEGGSEGLVERFIEAAQMLEQEGAQAIVSSCGFLALHQQSLAQAVSVPVISSALLAVPALQAYLAQRDQKLAVLTISEAALTQYDLAIGGDQPPPLIGAPRRDGPFAAPILANAPVRDFHAAEADLVQIAKAMTKAQPDIGALLLECTNMSAHNDAIEVAVGRPVLSLVNLISTMIRHRTFDLSDAVKIALA